MPAEAQAQLFDLAEGRRRRDAGLMKVASHEDPAWVRLAEGALRLLVITEDVFTVEDVRAYTGREPHNHNSWGALISAAKKRGDIVSVGYVQARRPERHANPIKAWRGAHA